MALVLTGSLAFGGTGTDDLTSDAVHSDEITSFKVTANVDTIEVPATMTTPIHGRGGAADYSLTISYLSNDIAGTFFRQLWSKLGTTLTFSGTMRSGSISATNPVWYGSFVVTEASLGAAAQQLSTGSTTFPMTGAPTKATT